MSANNNKTHKKESKWAPGSLEREEDLNIFCRSLSLHCPEPMVNMNHKTYRLYGLREYDLPLEENTNSMLVKSAKAHLKYLKANTEGMLIKKKKKKKKIKPGNLKGLKRTAECKFLTQVSIRRHDKGFRCTVNMPEAAPPKKHTKKPTHHPGTLDYNQP